MSKLLRTWLVIVLIIGVLVTMIDVMFKKDYDDIGQNIFMLIMAADIIFILGSLMLVAARKLGTLALWLSTAINIYYILYRSMPGENDLIKKVSNCVVRFDHMKIFIAEIKTPMSFLAFFLVLLIPLITLIWVQNNQSDFK